MKFFSVVYRHTWERTNDTIGRIFLFFASHEEKVSIFLFYRFFYMHFFLSSSLFWAAVLFIIFLLRLTFAHHHRFVFGFKFLLHIRMFSTASQLSLVFFLLINYNLPIYIRFQKSGRTHLRTDSCFMICCRLSLHLFQIEFLLFCGLSETNWQKNRNETGTVSFSDAPAFENAFMNLLLLYYSSIYSPFFILNPDTILFSGGSQLLAFSVAWW